MKKKVLIVGGVAGGASAAARLRRLDEQIEIILFERDEYISFSNCGLPYYIGDTIKEREKLLVQTPENMKKRFHIDVRVNSEVTGIDPARKIVAVRSLKHGNYEESYDELVLSPGARAIKPPIEGIDHPKVLTLRNIPDTDRIKQLVDSQGIHRAAIIGGGFVGVEMAENLRERGLEVTLVEAAPHILAPFDEDIAVVLEKELRENGVSLVLQDSVKAFRNMISTNQIEVALSSGAALTCDIVILAIGVAPDTAFLMDSGVTLGSRGHILTDEHMRTNIESIYAVGDAIEVVDFVTGKSTAIPLAGPANKQGRIAADNIAGLHSVFRGTQGSSILKVFGLTAAATGNNERMLRQQNIEYKVVHIHPSAHATYYPGSLTLTLKLLFASDGKILGAQGVGYDGVDKRIDVIAASIRYGGTVSDLAELELCYAPPFSSAKDPVNMVGFVAENVLSGRTDLIPATEFLQAAAEDTILLDVRSDLEYENGYLEGAVNIPLDELRDRINELDKSKTILVYCQVGLRGYIASRILTQRGYKVKNLSGGYKSAQYLTRKTETIKAGSSTVRQIINPETQVIRNEQKSGTHSYDQELDACGLCCPGPLIQVKSSMDLLEKGQILKVSASDPGFFEDIKAWCKRTNNELLELTKEKSRGTIHAYIQKGTGVSANTGGSSGVPPTEVKDNKTMVVFSGDLDKAIASFIIANGAASMGKKVTMFFTFWGLNILRKPEKVKVKKGLIDSMFGFMMPRGSKRLKLSNMNMMGLGAKMIRSVMKNKNVTSLEDLIKLALESGIEIVACQMSMDVMGLKQAELIDGIKIGGVGYYLGEAEDSNVNLFI